jgi:protein-disulfide isomerase
MNEESLANLSLTVSERDHTEGSAAAMVTLIEYGDYQCSQCQAASRIVEELRQQFGFRELRFVFRHFPLTQIHPHAFKAAEAAEAAGGQGKFWQMHRCRNWS